ncbi:hypothetical protein VTL71DRAFT_8687 [Oculimacula yallundae]|uniref:Uncharacterized protein n=1 Tax=Oculimacula yallundae TaxID=86028 RepID=A0ABR4CYE9_9HELO
MAPARHETGPPQLDGADDKTPYSTRASKRKATEITSGPPAARLAASPPSKLSTRAAKSKNGAKKTLTATESEPHQSPPTKKRRSSPPAIEPELPNSSSSANQSSEPPAVEENSGPSSNGNSCQENVHLHEPVTASATPGPEPDASDVPIPEVQVDAPSGSNEEDLDADAEGDDDDEVPVPEEDLLEPSNGVPEPTRGRGRGRGRGGRGFRGGSRGRGGRGGRGKASVGARGAKSAVPSTRGRGRGRAGRRKKAGDHRIDMVHKRKLELKAHFKVLAAMQRNALSVLADKSLESLQNDPLYHESLHEFEVVTEKLKEIYDENQARVDARVEEDMALANRKREYEEHMAEQQYRMRIEEIQETYQARIMEETNYVYAKRNAPKETASELDDIPFSRGEDGRIVKDSWLPQKKVHGTGMPFMNPPVAVSNVRSTAGDNDYEQHPANWWQAKTKAQKVSILKKQGECVAENLRHVGGRGKKGGRQALFQAQQESAEGGEAVEGEEEPEELPEDGPSRAASSGPSRPPTREGSTPEGNTNTSEDLEESDALPQDVDEFGVSIPRKKVRRDQPAAYNRIVSEAPVWFEDHEIGNRKTHMVKQPDGSFKRLGRDAEPNPERFYYEQRQGRYNAGKNVPEDLDQKIVATHKLHPRLGLPLGGSKNPDYNKRQNPYFKDRTDWQVDLEPTKPVMFIQHNADGTRTISRTSRSQWIDQAERSFKQIPVSQKMANLLEVSGDLQSRPSTPVTPDPPQIIAKDLIEAIEAASETQKEDEKRAAKEARKQASRPVQQQMFSPNRPPHTPMFTSPSAAVYSPPSGYQPQHIAFSPPQPMPPPPPARQERYDPVRDRVYVTPYAQQPRPPPPPPQVPPSTYNNGGGNLSELADAAWHYGGGNNANEYHSTMPPPPSFPLINPYSHPHAHSQHLNLNTAMAGTMGPGMGVFGQQPSHQSHSHTSPYGPPPTQQSPRSAGPSSRRAARELRPAPPAARPIQPQHPQGPQHQQPPPHAGLPHPQPQQIQQQPYHSYGANGSYPSRG